MNIATVELGDKRFLAAKLTLSEFSVVTGLASEISKASADVNPPRLAELIRALAEIICGCIRRAGSTTITVDAISEIASLGQISEAISVLMSPGSPKTETGVVN